MSCPSCHMSKPLRKAAVEHSNVEGGTSTGPDPWKSFYSLKETSCKPYLHVGTVNKHRGWKWGSLMYGKMTAMFWVFTARQHNSGRDKFLQGVHWLHLLFQQLLKYCTGLWDKRDVYEGKGSVITVGDAGACTQRVMCSALSVLYAIREKYPGTSSVLFPPVNLQKQRKFLRLDYFNGNFTKWNAQILFPSLQVNSKPLFLLVVFFFFLFFFSSTWVYSHIRGNDVSL